MAHESIGFQSLIAQARCGDEEAAAQIVEQYTAALVAVARRQIGPKLGRRVDPEDVVQSTYRSLFVRMQRGEYDLGNAKELWRLLVSMTLNKVRNQASHHQAQRRNLAAERSVLASDQTPSADQLAASDEPGPEEAAILVDEVQSFLETLAERERSIVELRLQGLSSSEIAAETGWSERSVRRILEQVHNQLRSRTN